MCACVIHIERTHGHTLEQRLAIGTRVDVAKFLLNLVGGDDFSSLYHSSAFFFALLGIFEILEIHLLFSPLHLALHLITFTYIHTRVIDGRLYIFYT